MLNIIEQAIFPHDKYQIEFKLDYELLEDQDTHYRISTYIFIPKSLGINAKTYNKPVFYRDIQNYIRLKTPAFSLGELSESPQMPLAQIHAIVQQENWNSNEALTLQLIDKLKLLSAMLKSALRDHIDLIYKRIDEAAPNAEIDVLISNLVSDFLIRSAEIAAQYRQNFSLLNLPHIDPKVFTAYSLTDETISLLFEESAIEIFQMINRYFKAPEKTTFKQQISSLVENETAHRRAFGYNSILNPENDNEIYLFRASVLKKYSASILHLSTAIEREGRGQEQILFALAAGISMIFATITAFYFQQNYGNFTFPVFVALVVGYMFKDRIKEFSQKLFSNWLDERIYDRRIRITTLDKKHNLGTLREKVRFVHEDDLPRLVKQARNKDTIIDLDNDGQGETIICYTKDIFLRAKAFKGAFAGWPKINGINDIMRYDIRNYLKKMDEPIQKRPSLQDGQLHTITCHKVYHLNFVSRYRVIQPHKDKLHTRTRLVLHRKGIKRKEHIEL